MTNQELLIKLITDFFTSQESNINKVDSVTSGLYIYIINKSIFSNQIPHFTVSDDDIIKGIDTNKEELEHFRKEAKKAGYIDFSLGDEGKYTYTIINA